MLGLEAGGFRLTWGCLFAFRVVSAVLCSKVQVGDTVGLA